MYMIITLIFSLCGFEAIRSARWLSSSKALSRRPLPLCRVGILTLQLGDKSVAFRNFCDIHENHKKTIGKYRKIVV